jgi:NTP pyrophosphatase (non-canonical NTP hydrolase)
MNFEELSVKVVDWGKERGIFDKGNPLSQLDKTQEELNETIEAVKQLTLFKNTPEDRQHLMGNPTIETADGIGDMLVTIIILSEMLGFNSVECLELAYDEIKDRTGKMVGGKFVKDKWGPLDGHINYAHGPIPESDRHKVLYPDLTEEEFIKMSRQAEAGEDK